MFYFKWWIFPKQKKNWTKKDFYHSIIIIDTNILLIYFSRCVEMKLLSETLIIKNSSYFSLDRIGKWFYSILLSKLSWNGRMSFCFCFAAISIISFAKKFGSEKGSAVLWYWWWHYSYRQFLNFSVCNSIFKHIGIFSNEFYHLNSKKCHVYETNSYKKKPHTFGLSPM